MIKCRNESNDRAEADDNNTWCTVRVAAERVLPTFKQGVKFWYKKTIDGTWINMTFLFFDIPKYNLIYLDQMNIQLFKPVELKTWYARVRKYARYGKNSQVTGKQTILSCRIFCGLPENTKNYFNPIKTERVRPKMLKTRFARL